MATIVTRAGKGSPLTNTEVDANFTNLNTDKAELSGATFTGEIVANAGIALGDSDQATFGAGDDLKLYHTGSHSYIDESGTGNLYIGSNNGAGVYIQGSGETLASFVDNGAVTLYHDNSPKLATTSTGIDVTGSATMDGLTVDGDSIITGNIGINTGTPDAQLEINSTSGATLRLSRSDGSITTDDRIGVIEFYQNDPSGEGAGVVSKIESINQSSFTGYGGLIFSTGQSASLSKSLEIGATGDISFYEDTGTTAKMVWDASAESLTLTNAVSGAGGWNEVLNLEANDYPLIALKSTGSGEVARIGNNGDGSLMFLVNGTDGSVGTTAATIDSSGRVGIGTSSPWETLSIPFNEKLSFGSSAYPFSISRSAAGQLVTTFEDGYNASNTRIDFKMRGGAVTPLSLVGSGNVGIGTSSPAQKLHITGSAPFARLESTSTSYNGFNALNDSGNFYFGIDDSGGNFYGSAYARAIYSDGAYPVTFYTNAAERMRIDSSGNVGIGTSSPNEQMALYKASANQVVTQYGNSSTGDGSGNGFIVGVEGSGNGIVWNRENSFIRFGTNATERMRIDSSGNLLLNRSATFTTAKMEIQSDAGDASTLALNSIDTDGSILEFYKAGNTVGSIGVNSAELGIGGGDANLLFMPSDNAIAPSSTSSGGASDGVLDLGRSARRFKDLYLSGGANVGSLAPTTSGAYGSNHVGVHIGGITLNAATGQTGYIMTAGSPAMTFASTGATIQLGGLGAANKLDDYEEGTFTPVFTGSTGNPTINYNTQTGSYTKVGRLVTFNVFIITNSRSGGSGQLNVAGLPFTVLAGHDFGATIGFNFNWVSGEYPQHAIAQANTNHVILYKDGSSNAINEPDDILASGNSYLRVTGFYYTSA